MVPAIPLFLLHILIEIHATSHFKNHLCDKENIMTSLNSGQRGHFKQKCKEERKKIE